MAGEVLLDRGRSHPLAELLYISGDMDRLDFIEAAHALPLAPLKKFYRGTTVRRARVRIADVDGEKFEEAFLCPAMIAGSTTLPCPAVFPITSKSPCRTLPPAGPIYYLITSFMS
jgi:hypothetical protein